VAPERLLAAAIVGALVLYLMFGGADFGGGVWDLLATGPRRAQQRTVIEQAIGPIWEANHVWLILAVVLLFAGFPPAFAAVSIALHVPLTLLLLGIVFRGAAFAFRSFDPGHRRGLWGVAFSVPSVLAPLLLGVVVGATASGRLPARAALARGDIDFVSPWLAPFPLVIGGLTLALCAFLAAVYLAHEAEALQGAGREVADDFRRRAFAAGAATAVLALVAVALARTGAPRMARGLIGEVLGVVAPLAALLAGGCAVALWRRRFALARLLAAGQAALIVLGWAAAQWPYLIVDSLTVHDAAASPPTLRLLLWALAAGLVVLVPCLVLLFRIFKGPAQR
jgi:cytochrome d ubiquinol oxidase subunit II